MPAVIWSAHALPRLTIIQCYQWDSLHHRQSRPLFNAVSKPSPYILALHAFIYPFASLTTTVLDTHTALYSLHFYNIRTLIRSKSSFELMVSLCHILWSE